jgi:hypothetical protein
MALPDYLEDTSKDFARQATAAYSAPINTDTFTGRQFVAGQDPLQTQAAALATQGVGSYSPYLQAAQTFQGQSAGALGDSASTIGGLGSLTGANAYQPFMSPYQTQVIDATLSEYDKSRLGGQQNIRDAAVNSGNFGGGREGAMMGQYNADSLVNRAALQNQMLQQGFTQANQLAQQNFKAYNQALLTADQQQAQTGAYEPYGRLNQYGNMLTGLSGGVAGQQYQDQRQSDPYASALSGAMGVAGLFGQIYGNRY